MSKDLKQKKSDYLLEVALEEQLEQDEDMKKYPLPEDVEHPHVFSEEHEKRMQEIFKMADKVEHQSYRRKKHFQLAAGIALFLCLTTVTVTQVEAFRLPVFRFFSEVMEKSTYYGVEEVQTELSSRYQMYEPTYVLEGFHVTKVKEEDNYFELHYENDATGQAYNLYFREDLKGFFMDTENAETEERDINGNRAFLSVKENVVRMLMYKDNHQFFISGIIDKNNAVKILESIK